MGTSWCSPTLVAEAEKAYELIQTGGEPYLGVVLRYPEIEAPTQRKIV